MADNQEISTSGGAAIQGSVNTNGGDATLRDRITVNNGDPVLNYTLADLRIDIHFQKQEIDRLRDELNRDRQTDATTSARLTARLDTMQNNLDFLDEQVKGMLLMKPVPAQTQTVPLWMFYVMFGMIFIFVVFATFFLTYLARGR